MTLTLTVRDPLDYATAERRRALAESGFIESLVNRDSSLWGLEAQAEASIRLGWTAHPSSWIPLAREVMALREELSGRGIDRVVLCGMGGSSLGPEVMAASASIPLTVIDATHPDEVGPELARDLSGTAVVVSSKSGGTVETDSQRRAFEAALVNQGLNPVDHIVIVTDPGSPLHHASHEAGYRVFEGDATIGGRFSAISPFGLVPMGLAGMDLLAFLEDASAGYEACRGSGEDNPALRLGVALAQGHPTVNKILYREDPSHPGLGDWVEQLVAESTGKDGKGILPVVGTSLDGLPDALSVGGAGSESEVEISGNLAEHMILWEFATVVACAEIGVNPFDQPNVESAKVAARELLESTSVASRAEEDFDVFSVFAKPPLPALESLSELPKLLGQLAGKRGYIAVCVFAPRTSQSLWREVGHSIERTTGRPVTIGFGPRFLHSTGQLHKGGAPEGVFLQIIATPHTEVEIPGRDFGFSELLLSQAHGDARVLVGTGQPVISMTGSRENVARLVEALRA